MVRRGAIIISVAAAGLVGVALYAAFGPRRPPPDDDLEKKKEEGRQLVTIQLLDQGTINGAFSGTRMVGAELSLDGNKKTTDANGEATWRQVAAGEHEIRLGNADIHDTNLITHDGFVFQGEVLNPIHMDTKGGAVVAQIVVHERSLEQIIGEGEDETFTLNITIKEAA